MASTVDQVIARFRRIFPDCDAAYALTLFQDAHREVLTRCRLRESTVTVNLAEGIRLYDLAASSLLVMQVDYLRSASDFKTLTETSVDALDMTDRGWRVDTLSTGEPDRYVVVGSADGDSAKMQIGFDPVPSVATLSGYPVVKVHCIQEGVLSGAETVPGQLLSDRVYVTHMAVSYTLERDLEKHAFYRGLWEDEIKRNVEHVKSRLARLPTRVFGTVGRRERLV